MAVATFTALQTPLLDAGTQLTSYTWQQKFIEWERKINAALPIATTIALGTVKPDGTTITITAGGVISAVTGVSNRIFNEQVAQVAGVFTLAHVPINDAAGNPAVVLYSGSARIFPGLGADYTISGAVITPNYVIPAGSLWADYQY